MTYEIKAFQLTDKGIIPLDYYKPEHFIQQEDASILLNKIFVKQYRRDYGEIIGVILHLIKKKNYQHITWTIKVSWVFYASKERGDLLGYYGTNKKYIVGTE